MDVSSEINVYIEEHRINIIFAENEIKTYLKNDRVGFYLDDANNLIGICINEITQENKRVLLNN